MVNQHTLIWFLKERLLIRRAKARDAEEFCKVIRTSITELCVSDHRGIEAELKDWLKNKTVQNCKEWIENSSSNTFVAEQSGKIVGVSHIGHNGHLYLCYVLPEVKGRGFGKQLLIAAEESVLHLGLQFLTLESTITAKKFYEHFGYINAENSQSCLKYSKSIQRTVRRNIEL